MKKYTQSLGPGEFSHDPDAPKIFFNQLIRAPLPYKKIDYGEWAYSKGYDKKWDRVLFFDPTPVFARIQFNPHKRIQSIPADQMFPSIPGHCSCGCGQPLTGRQTRWASDTCSSFAYEVRAIICNTGQRPAFYITKYYGNKCSACPAPGEELDHTIPVKHGGGACWLSNFRWLCRKCHRVKTNKDFGHKSPHM